MILYTHKKKNKFVEINSEKDGRGRKGVKITVKDLDLSFKIFCKIFPFSERNKLLTPKINML